MSSSRKTPKALSAAAMTASAASVALNAVVATHTTSAQSTVHVLSIVGTAASGLAFLSLSGLCTSHLLSTGDSPSRVLPSWVSGSLFASSTILSATAATFGTLSVIFIGQLASDSRIAGLSPVALLSTISVITLVGFLVQMALYVNIVSSRRPKYTSSAIDCESRLKDPKGSPSNIKSIRYSTTMPATSSPVSTSTLTSNSPSMEKSMEKSFDARSFSSKISPAPTIISHRSSPAATIRSHRINSPISPSPAVELERVTSAALSISTVASGTTISSPIASPPGITGALTPRPSSRLLPRVSLESLQSTTQSVRSLANTMSFANPSVISSQNPNIGNISSTLGDRSLENMDSAYSHTPTEAVSSSDTNALNSASSPSSTTSTTPVYKSRPILSRLLETIPQSPTAPIRSRVGHAVRSSCPESEYTGILDLPPVIDPDSAPRGRGRSRTQGATASPRMSSTTPNLHRSSAAAKPVEAEAHIHPLFRSDSPGPPPLATPGTVVLAAPAAGRVLASRVSIRSLRRIRSGSMPVVRSSLSRQSSVDDFNPATAVHDEMPPLEDLDGYDSASFKSAETSNNVPGNAKRASKEGSEVGDGDSDGGSEVCEQALTPLIPDWVLSSNAK
ncbi:hypothetical protein CFIMG_004539RAa [Ceratocystis fimbriata CBS 114723]|uniref:Uncharacterized protein n=1 Tax=Ceratocystis fimbriata CBS 114723 TaxID=1035309 RepID=A0A2C5XA74_9PEZI|nr:hypothetical protein CFIMG_004539RAa [Ceratocystis fimbriata CBS 114723]